MSDGAGSPDRTGSRFAVGPCVVDLLAHEILGPKGRSALEPKVSAVLCLFAQRSGQLCTREEIIGSLWPEGEGGDESLTRVVYLLRKVFRDEQGLSNIIKTVSKRGYIFHPQVCWLSGDPEHGILRPASISAEVPKTLSVGVLPVELASLDDRDFFLAEGLTRDLTSLLSKGTKLKVAPYSTMQRAAAQLQSPQETAAQVGVRYLLSGTLRRSENTIRLRMELVDESTRQVVWSHKCTAALDDLFEIQEDMVLSISTAVSARIKMPGRKAIGVRGRLHLEAYELVQATETLRLIYSREIAMQITDDLSRALEMEPNNALVRAALAVQISQNCVSQWVDDLDAAMDAADEHVRLALRTAADDADVVASAGVVAAMFHRPAEAIAHLSRAMELDPNNAHALAVLGWQKCILHSDRSGIEDIRTAEARAPHHPRFGLWATYRATAHLFMLEHELAVPACREAIVRTPNYYQPYLSLAWALTACGEPEAAAASVAEAEKIDHDGILGEFVVEMRKWSANSPNKADVWAVLDRLEALRA